MKRLSWDDYGMALAKTAALRGDCRRTRVGAFILAADHHFVGGGYNGVDPGEVGCLDGACPRGLLSKEELPPLSDYESGPGRCIARHAEDNALLFTDRSERIGGTIYVTYQPCSRCMKSIKGSGLIRAVWPGGEWGRWPSA